MKIRMICTCILAAAMLLARPVSGQTDASALEAALHGKALGLRSYSADPVAKYTWVDGKLLPDPIVLHGVQHRIGVLPERHVMPGPSSGRATTPTRTSTSTAG